MTALLPAIRDARPGDVPAMADVCARATRQAYTGLVTGDYIERVIAHWYGHDRLLRELGAGADWLGFVVATMGEHVAGVAGTGVAEDGDGELFTLYVDPAWHRRGVGRALVAHEMQRARTVGRTRLDVAVLPGNLPAVRFYERCGFTYSHERPIHAPHGSDGGPEVALVFSRPL